MVIEYAGTVIRAVLTDKRQKYYDSKVSSRYTRIVTVVLKWSVHSCCCHSASV